MDCQNFFATCARGLEPALADELVGIGAAGVHIGRGGVHFDGDQAMLYRANLWLRTAIRVLQPILRGHVESPEELYELVGQVDWSVYMTPDHTLAVDSNVRDSKITHSKYAALKTKDAICDQFVTRCGRRPSVDVEEPLVGLNLHIYRDEMVLSLDSSGESLHKRGYRTIIHKAALNEALAAGLLLLSGWKATVPLIDPLCGSGTIPIEATWMALQRPPGLTRRRFGFQGWMDYDVRLWTELRDLARQSILKQLPVPVYASDLRGDGLRLARDGAKAAGVGHLLRFDQRDLADLQAPPGSPGIILCNPPYGERIGEKKDLEVLYRLIGQVVRERCPGWKLFVLSGDPNLARRIDLPVIRQIPLFNGRLPCKFIEFGGAASRERQRPERAG